MDSFPNAVHRPPAAAVDNTAPLGNIIEVDNAGSLSELPQIIAQASLHAHIVYARYAAHCLNRSLLSSQYPTPTLLPSFTAPSAQR